LTSITHAGWQQSQGLFPSRPLMKRETMKRNQGAPAADQPLWNRWIACLRRLVSALAHIMGEVELGTVAAAARAPGITFSTFGAEHWRPCVPVPVEQTQIIALNSASPIVLDPSPICKIDGGLFEQEPAVISRASRIRRTLGFSDRGRDVSSHVAAHRLNIGIRANPPDPALGRETRFGGALAALRSAGRLQIQVTQKPSSGFCCTG